MSCQQCKSERLLTISAKCSDLCFCEINNKKDDGYVPSDAGIGGGDYVKFTYCLNCGQIQGEFPLPTMELEEEQEEEENLSDYEDEDDND